MNTSDKTSMIMRKLFSFVLVLFAAAIAFSSPALADGPADCLNIKTEKGIVSGVANANDKLCLYKGIPYAAPPVGDLRFALPKEHESWQGELKADKYGSECLQAAISLFPSNKISGSEDCLYLNVTAPQSAATELKPVMVFIHGGGFLYGSGDMDPDTGTGLITQGGVVLVTINYRLGPFGFMAHPAFKDSDGNYGNYGIWDQLAALKWVKKNIKNFGGDPDNTTVFGESAGGMSVGILLASPLAEGLFQKAIIESGPVLIVNKNMGEEQKVGIAAAEKLGCPDPATAAKCMRSLDPMKIISEAPPIIFFMATEESKASFPYGPAADGKLMPAIPYMMYKQGKFNKNVKVIIGTNSDEASYFIVSRKLDTPEQFKQTLSEDAAMMKSNVGLSLDADKIAELYPVSKYPTPRKAYSDVFTDLAFTCTARVMADMIYDTKKSDIYLYYFTKKPQENGPFKDWGAFHGSELAFVFGKFEFMGIKFGSKANTVTSKEVIDYWSSFARTGVPSGEGIPAWPQFNSKDADYMRLDKDMSVISNIKTEQCEYIRSVFDKALTR